MPRISDDEFQAFLKRGGVARDAAGKVIEAPAAAAKGNKYGAKKTQVDGVMFDSKLEAKRFVQLQAMQRAGEITDLEIQPNYVLDSMQLLRPLRFHPTRQYPDGKTPEITLDYRYRLAETGQFVLEDTKGRMTADAQLRIAIFEAMYGVDVVILKKGDI